MSNSFFSEEELQHIGFAKVGHDVRISRKTSIYSAENISLGNHIRIDDFCVLSGKINIGDHVHIAVFCALFGGNEGIILEDYSGLSSRCAVYAITDDYSGEYMTNPTVPACYTHIIEKKVTIGRHCDVGTGSVILPGVEIGEGCAIGAMTLVGKSTKPWGLYMGYQCVRIQDRSQNLLQLESKLREMDK